MKLRVGFRLSSHELWLVLEQLEQEIPRGCWDGWNKQQELQKSSGKSKSYPLRLLPTALEQDVLEEQHSQ